MILLLLLAGCGGRPYHYTDERQTAPGPGLITGKSGGFNLLGGPEKTTEKTIAKEKDSSSKNSALSN